MDRLLHLVLELAIISALLLLSPLIVIAVIYWVFVSGGTITPVDITFYKIVFGIFGPFAFALWFGIISTIVKRRRYNAWKYATFKDFPNLRALFGWFFSYVGIGVSLILCSIYNINGKQSLVMLLLGMISPTIIYAIIVGIFDHKPISDAEEFRIIKEGKETYKDGHIVYENTNHGGAIGLSLCAILTMIIIICGVVAVHRVFIIKKQQKVETQACWSTYYKWEGEQLKIPISKSCLVMAKTCQAMNKRFRDTGIVWEGDELEYGSTYCHPY